MKRVQPIPATEAEIIVGLDAASFRSDFLRRLFLDVAKFPGVASGNDHYIAIALAVRDRLLHRWVSSARTFLEGENRTLIYLSAEYLLGPQLANNLLALGAREGADDAMTSLGLSLDALIEDEVEPGLGNGGLGRLAACYMDSLATLEYPAIGHGIRYEFGIFDQDIRDGEQIEKADTWLRHGNPWEVRRWDIAHRVGFGGATERLTDALGRQRVRWMPDRVVDGVPHDTPILGYQTTNTNFLRLWAAVPSQEFDLEAFNDGQYWKAVEDKVRSENLSKILYPNDKSPAGKQLRLEQQYFFVSCALQDAIRVLLQKVPIRRFAEKYAIQLNDTHPSLAIPELMRLLLDEHGLTWDEAWEITHKSISYTNHTLLPEALETWPLPLFQAVLPRHVEIIFEINHRFLAEVRARFPGDTDRVARMSLVDERGGRALRMAHLAVVGSHCVNGVAALHSHLLTTTVLTDFAELWPDRFTNVTNGVTPRRFVALTNPGLSGLITASIGDGWQRDLERLQELEPFAEDASFRDAWRVAKAHNKENLARYLAEHLAVDVDPLTMFDVQCKRIHEYKRQHLLLLYAIWRWHQLRDGLLDDAPPRTILVAGKAAPGYTSAKRIIRLATAVGDAIAKDPIARRRLRVVFVPDFNVRTAQRLYPAADLSEQISTAGLEASGTGNMKLALNGALTVGTLDGANVEIREAVGAENFFLFGMTAAEVAARRPTYRPRAVIDADPELESLLGWIDDGGLVPDQPDLFAPLVRDLVDHDPFFVLADFRAYVDAQARVDAAWADPEAWTRASILNTARCGRFSSDRAVKEYAERIWHLTPSPVKRSR